MSEYVIGISGVDFPLLQNKQTPLFLIIDLNNGAKWSFIINTAVLHCGTAGVQRVQSQKHLSLIFQAELFRLSIVVKKSKMLTVRRNTHFLSLLLLLPLTSWHFQLQENFKKVFDLLLSSPGDVVTTLFSHWPNVYFFSLVVIAPRRSYPALATAEFLLARSVWGRLAPRHVDGELACCCCVAPCVCEAQTRWL